MTLNVFEPVVIYRNLLDNLDLDSQAKVSEILSKCFSIYEINGRGAVALGLLPSITRECARSDEQSFISTTNHCSTEIANRSRRYGTGVTLALEYNVEGQNTAELDNANAINTTVAALSGYLNIIEAKFTQQPLTKTLKG